jgi:thiol:disulfide interchange protein DsbA
MQILTNIIKTLILTLFLGNALATGDYDEGVEYLKIAKPVATQNPDKVEVREVFWYQCPHCFDLEPVIKNWLKTKPDNVDFVQSPVMFSFRTEMGAKQYYTLVELGLIDKLHEPLFKAIHEQKKRFNTDKTFANWVASVSSVDAEKVLKTMKSFAVRIQINKATISTHKYGITGVPVVIVNGKYLTNATLAGSHQDMMQVVDFLVAKESKSK